MYTKNNNEDRFEILRCIRDVRVGYRTKIHNFVNLYECELGDDVMIGTFVEIQSGVIIGDGCRIQSHSFICEGVELEERVFVGHGVMFINDRQPRAVHPAEMMRHKEGWKAEKTIVRKGASIGTGAIILSGIEIGENAVIGAGAVVTRSVPPHTTVVGVPARNLTEHSR
ncbi:MAG: N-acetyltransferase [bacterium]|nr:N-acetyltransferase [bacterium]